MRKCAKLFRKSIGQQVEHRHHDQAIACQVGILVNKLHGNALPCKGIIVPLQLIPIAHTGIARPTGAFQRPFILPIMDYRSLLFSFYRCNFSQSLQFFPYLRSLRKRTGILPPIVADDSAMKFFLRAAAGAPLEIKHTVCTVCHRLQRGKLCNAGLFLLGNRLPVGKAGAGLHQQERLVLH